MSSSCAPNQIVANSLSPFWDAFPDKARVVARVSPPSLYKSIVLDSFIPKLHIFRTKLGERLTNTKENTRHEYSGSVFISHLCFSDFMA